MWLLHGDYRLDVVPAQGALVRRFQWRDGAGRWRDLLRPPPRGDIDPASPRRFGLWPMAPFCNRAFGAVMHDGEVRHALPVNDPATGSCIHGFGWQAEWRISARGRGQLCLVHERAGAGDAYAYRAELKLTLAAEGLTLTLAVENRACQALPFGIGLHPWFPAAADTTLTLRAGAELALGPGYRAMGVTPLPEGGPFAQGLPARREAETAHSFIGWEGAAVIATPSAGLTITLDAGESLRCPVVWAPPGADFICVEPQSHGIGAPSEAAARAATPMARLQPGESLAGSLRISASRAARG
jgi:aldose 1-epimerase